MDISVAFPYSRKLTWPNSDMVKAELYSEIWFHGRNVKGTCFHCAVEKDMTFFLKSQKFSDNQKTTSHLSFQQLYLVNYIIVKNRVCLYSFIFPQIESHNIGIYKLPTTAQHENGILIIYSQLFSDH